MVAAWTLVRPSLTRRARVVSVEMTMGRFVLRSVALGRQEPSAAVVIPAVHPTWHNAAKPAQRPTRRGGVQPEPKAHGAGQIPASPHGTAPRRYREVGAVSPRQSIVTRTGQDRLRRSVERSGMARGSRNSSPRIFASLPLEPSHHRSAIRLGKPARPIVASTARSASSPCRRGRGRGPEPATLIERLLPLARGALRLSVMTMW